LPESKPYAIVSPKGGSTMFTKTIEFLGPVKGTELFDGLVKYGPRFFNDVEVRSKEHYRPEGRELFHAHLFLQVYIHGNEANDSFRVEILQITGSEEYTSLTLILREDLFMGDTSDWVTMKEETYNSENGRTLQAKLNELFKLVCKLTTSS